MEWNNLKNECLSCTQCGLADTRQQVVFGSGNPNAKLMFIGEAPGEQEDLHGRPFIGRSGKLLDEYLNFIGLNREDDLYIANIVKCHPPENRDPSVTERKACAHWLEEQIRIMQPKIIVCVGRIAAQILIRPNFAIMKERGEYFEQNGILYTAILHPAALLRNPGNKPLAAEDFQKLKEKINEYNL